MALWLDDQSMMRHPPPRPLTLSSSPSVSRERLTTAEMLALPLSWGDRERLSATCTKHVFVCTDVQQFIRNRTRERARAARCAMRRSSMLASSRVEPSHAAGGRGRLLAHDRHLCRARGSVRGTRQLFGPGVTPLTRARARAGSVAALVAGRDFVTPDDVLHVLFSVVSHRVVLSQQLYALLHDSSDADPLASPARTAGSATGASPRSNAPPSSLHAFLDTILRQARRAVSVPVHVRGPR
jgi:hypothetical protein